MLVNKKSSMGLAQTLTGDSSADLPPSINNINTYYRPTVNGMNSMNPEAQISGGYAYTTKTGDNYGYFIKIDDYGSITNMPMTGTLISGTGIDNVPAWNYSDWLVKDTSGNYYGLFVITPNGGTYPYIQTSIGVVKFNSSMQFVAARRVFYQNQYAAYSNGSINIDSSNNIYVTGLIETWTSPPSTPLPSTKKSSLEVKLNTSLNIVSQSCLEPTGGGVGYAYYFGDMFIDGSGNRYYNETYNSSGTSWGIIKTNSSGTIQWRKKFNSGAFYNTRQALRGVYNNELYCVSESITSPVVPTITKLDSNGTIVWQKTISATNYYQFSLSDLFIKNNRIFLSGQDLQSTISNSSTQVFIEIDSNGNILDSVASPKTKIVGPGTTYYPYFRLADTESNLYTGSFIFPVGSANTSGTGSNASFLKIVDDWTFPRGTFKIPLWGGTATLSNYTVNIANVGSPTALSNYTVTTTAATSPAGSVTLTSVTLSSATSTAINNIQRYVTYMGT